MKTWVRGSEAASDSVSGIKENKNLTNGWIKITFLSIVIIQRQGNVWNLGSIIWCACCEKHSSTHVSYQSWLLVKIVGKANLSHSPMQFTLKWITILRDLTCLFDSDSSAQSPPPPPRPRSAPHHSNALCFLHKCCTQTVIRFRVSCN